MNHPISWLCAVPLILLAAGPAQAADEAAFATIAERAVINVIRPGYDRLAATSATMTETMSALCGDPAPVTLTAARSRFGDLVRDWSAVELIRFGPVRDENRFERIFFWPDRKGIGLRQVQAALAERDTALLDPAALAARSVAMQGLGALEFALFGDGAETLAATSPDEQYRCRFGSTVARTIAGNAADIAAAWRSEDGFARLMREPGDDNPVFRTSEEVLRQLIGAMTQQLEFVRDTKLTSALGTTPAEAKPQRVPFWRSGLALPAMRANIESVRGLFNRAEMTSALNAETRWIAEQFDFEIGNAVGALGRVGRPFVEAAVLPESHELMLFSRVPMAAAQQLLSTGYAGATGLTLGFNALDGD